MTGNQFRQNISVEVTGNFETRFQHAIFIKFPVNVTELLQCTVNSLTI